MFIHILTLMYFQLFTLAFGTTHSKLYMTIHSYGHIPPPYILTCILSCMPIPIQTIAHFSTNTVILNTHTLVFVYIPILLISYGYTLLTLLHAFLPVYR